MKSYSRRSVKYTSVLCHTFSRESCQVSCLLFHASLRSASTRTAGIRSVTRLCAMKKKCNVKKTPNSFFFLVPGSHNLLYYLPSLGEDYFWSPIVLTSQENKKKFKILSPIKSVRCIYRFIQIYRITIANRIFQ